MGNPISNTMKVVALAFCIATPVLGENLIQRLERKETRAAHGRHLLKYSGHGQFFSLNVSEYNGVLSRCQVKPVGMTGTDYKFNIVKQPWTKSSMLSLGNAIKEFCTEDPALAEALSRDLQALPDLEALP